MTDSKNTPEHDDQIERADEEAAREAADDAKEAVTQTTSSSGTGKPRPSRAKKKAEPVAETAEAETAPADEKPKRTRTRRAKDDEAAKPAAAPAPSRRRGREAPVGVEVRAQAKYVRTSARKARLVCDHIRGKDVAEARAILAFTPRAAAKDWAKLLESAVANAEHNHELVGDDLRIAAVYADEGPTLKRFRPRAMGRATRIRKRTSHLTITLTPKEG